MVFHGREACHSSPTTRYCATFAIFQLFISLLTPAMQQRNPMLLSCIPCNATQVNFSTLVAQQTPNVNALSPKPNLSCTKNCLKDSQMPLLCSGLLQKTVAKALLGRGRAGNTETQKGRMWREGWQYWNIGRQIVRGGLAMLKHRKAECEGRAGNTETLAGRLSGEGWQCWNTERQNVKGGLAILKHRQADCQGRAGNTETQKGRMRREGWQYWNTERQNVKGGLAILKHRQAYCQGRAGNAETQTVRGGGAKLKHRHADCQMRAGNAETQTGRLSREGNAETDWYYSLRAGQCWNTDCQSYVAISCVNNVVLWLFNTCSCPPPPPLVCLKVTAGMAFGGYRKTLLKWLKQQQISLHKQAKNDLVWQQWNHTFNNHSWHNIYINIANKPCTKNKHHQ